MAARILVMVVSILVVGLLAGCSAGDERTPRTRRDSGMPMPMPGVDSGTPWVPYDAGPRPDVGPLPGVDRDGDGIPDADEAGLGTNPDAADTDGDGYGDGVEVVAGTDPTSAASAIPPTDFYVVLPFGDPAITRELDFTARLGRGDVFFLVDTTGSMGIAIGNVRSSLSTMIVPAVNEAIADVVMGVGDFRDFPQDPYGDPGDWPFLVRQTMTSDVARVQEGLNMLAAGGGADGPESQVEGLYRSVAGGAAACGPDGGFGEACFRTESHPIIVVVTDVPSHNGPTACDDYRGVAGAHTWAETRAALNTAMARIVGVAVDSGFGFPFPIPCAMPRPELEAIAMQTESRAFDGSLTVYDAPGGSVSSAVVDGIIDLVGATRQDVTSQTRDDGADEVDATRFIKAVRPVSATRATRFDDTTFYGVAGGTTVTFEVTFQNDFFMHELRVRIFRAYIDVVDLPDRTTLDSRNVYIVVPAMDGTLF